MSSLTLRWLLHEILTQIINYIPLKEWPKLYSITDLKPIILQQNLWKNLNLNSLDGVSEEFIELLHDCAFLIRELIWNAVLSYGAGILTSQISPLQLLLVLDLLHNLQVDTLDFLPHLIILQVLKLCSCHSIHPADFMIFIPHLLKLKYLDLYSCLQLKWHQLFHLLRKLNKLEWCNISDCCDVSCLNIISLQHILLNVKYLEFTPELYFEDLDNWFSVIQKYKNLHVADELPQSH